MNETTPNQIIRHGHFFQNTLLDHSRFIDFCKKRGIYIDERRLEKFEELGIFLPMLRVDYPVTKIKVKTKITERGESVFEEFGNLEEGETWDKSNYGLDKPQLLSPVGCVIPTTQNQTFRKTTFFVKLLSLTFPMIVQKDHCLK